MKKVLSFFLFILFVLPCNSQTNAHPYPVIDMHLHVYTPTNYWGGRDARFRDTVLKSPKSQPDHLEAVIKQITKHNIVLTFASGNFQALDIINKSYPDLFLPSAEIWPSEKLFSNPDFIKTLEQKIQNGEVRALGEVVNFYTGFAPNDPLMDTLYRIAEKNDIPIGLHFAPGPRGSQLNAWPHMRLEYANPYTLQDVLIKFPKLRLFVMHAGLPMYLDETLAMLFMFPNLYVDISTQCWYSNYTKESLDEFLRKAVKYGFGDRIMFGSDEMTWPGAIGLSVDYINQADFLSEKQKQDILFNNAARFLKLTDEQINKYTQQEVAE